MLEATLIVLIVGIFIMIAFAIWLLKMPNNPGSKAPERIIEEDQKEMMDNFCNIQNTVLKARETVGDPEYVETVRLSKQGLEGILQDAGYSIEAGTLRTEGRSYVDNFKDCRIVFDLRRDDCDVK